MDETEARVLLEKVLFKNVLLDVGVAGLEAFAGLAVMNKSGAMETSARSL